MSAFEGTPLSADILNGSPLMLIIGRYASDRILLVPISDHIATVSFQVSRSKGAEKWQRRKWQI